MSRSHRSNQKCIILFSTADWDNPFWTNKQHMAVQFAERGYRVFYIESLGLRQPQFKGADFNRIIKRILKFFKGVKNVRPNLYVYSPLVIPFHRFAGIRALNSVLLKGLLFFYQWKYALKNPLIWTYNPMVLDLMQFLRTSSATSMWVYHSVDDLSAAPGVDRATVLAHEDELLKAVDFVFCTSRKIEARCRKIAGNKVHFFNNVVDEEHFSKARKNLAEPFDLKTIPHPRIGFIGALSSYKFDVQEVSQAANKHPEWNWVLIGKVGEGQPDTDMESLMQTANIHFIGPKPYAELPAYLKYFDVAMIPSPLNDYTQSMFPMKFFEYMAAGKPMVASEIDSLREYQDYFYSYSSGKLAEALETALQAGVKNPDACLRLVHENTWSRRLDRMLSLLKI